MFASRFRSRENIRKRKNFQRGLWMEALEHRRLLAADINGTFYEDVDSNGIKSGPDNTLSGWLAFVDIDQNGRLNNLPDGTSEPFAVANGGGDYVINMAGRPSGVYRVSEVVQAGWTPTSPVSRDVSFSAGQSTSQVDFFNFAGGKIQGTVWEDLDEDGVRDIDVSTGQFTDPGLAGWVVFLDLQPTGGGGRNQLLDPGEPFTVTDTLGNYSFTDLPAGDYEVTEVLPDGWDVPSGFDSQQTAEVVALGTTLADFANFSVLNGSIEGAIWNDVNGNGDRELDLATGLPTEPGLAGWTVYIDVNANGVLDSTEQSTLTDGDGSYHFASVLAGSYRVREILPPNWSPALGFGVQQIVVVVAGEKTKDVDFANFTVLNGAITGSIWNDINRDGIRNSVFGGGFSDPGLAGWTVYLDLNGSGAFDAGEPTALTDVNGVYVFPDLQIGEYDVIEVVPSGWETTPGFDDNHTVRVYSGATSTAPDFANFNLSTLIAGSVSGSVWDDANGNGVRDLTPTAEHGSAGWVVFVDTNNNRVAEATEPQSTSSADGTFTISGVTPGTVTIVVQARIGWHSTSPSTGTRSLTLKNGESVSGINFGAQQIRDASLSGTVYADKNTNGIRDLGEQGLEGIVVYLDLNQNATLDIGEPSTLSSEDKFFTPAVDESGTYSFTHLAAGSYPVRQIVPARLSATPASAMVYSVTVGAAQSLTGIDFADVYRRNEIHGVKFNDLDVDGVRDVDEPGIAGTTVFIDLDRDDVWDVGEPVTVTHDDGTYEFLDLSAGAYVVREVLEPGHHRTSPRTAGGILWPDGVSNAAVGNVSPLSITQSLAQGERSSQHVTITLPGSGGLTNLVDVFLLFDDTGSFTFNSPIVRGAFPTIMSDLRMALPGVDFGFGVGRFEEYGNFGAEYSTGRPFVLNQPIVSSSTTGYQAAIQAALNRTAPGYGGDEPETDIEALYQLVTGLGFDGNNNGSVMDSGAAGLASTQLTPGNSGDVPSFTSFTVDAANGALPSAGTIGGGGFRAGALPVILLATDTGFAYQPKGETNVSGMNGLSLPISSLTQRSRPTTPFGSGAGLQETITGLNALGALVIGLGTNSAATVDPRLGLESIAKLTGATNQTTATIANGTTDPIAPGDPFYFQISSGFASSVSAGVKNAIQNAVTNVAVNITVQSSDPRVQIINHTGTRVGVSSGEIAEFDIEFVGDGVPHRFDLQFVREGTNVVLGSIPVVLGTPIPGDGYHFDDLDDGEIELEDHFGDSPDSSLPPNVAPSFVAGADQMVAEDAGLQSVFPWATNISAGPANEGTQVTNFLLSTDNPTLFSVTPSISANGTLTFTTAPNAYGTATIAVTLHDNGGTANGGQDTSAPQQLRIIVTEINDIPDALNDAFSVNQDSTLNIATRGVLGNDIDVDGDVLTATQVVTVTHGSVVLAADGSFTYTPTSGFFGTDNFTYFANDGTSNSNIATVSITVNAVNQAPIVQSDRYTTDEDMTLTTGVPGVLGNDHDSDSLLLTAVLDIAPQHGALIFNEVGSFTYIPNTNFHGTDTFAYHANDGTLDSAIAVVEITVNPVNDDPIGELLVTGLLVENSVLTADTSRILDADGLGEFSYSWSNGATTQAITLDDANVGQMLGVTVSYTDGSGKLESVTSQFVGLIANVNDIPSGLPIISGVAQNGQSLIALTNGISDGDGLGTFTFRWTRNDVPIVGANSSTYQLSGADVGAMLAVSVTYLDGHATSEGPLLSTPIGPIIDIVSHDAKFRVVDSADRRTYQYDAGGEFLVSKRLDEEDESPRGIAANADASIQWVVDEKGEVFVYDSRNRLLGAWEAKEVDKPEGITVHGSDVWIVDRGEDRVSYFKNGATRRSGSAKPTSSFDLDRRNRNPMDIVTDGTHVWIVDDGKAVDKVFRYSLFGLFEGSWGIDFENSQPTGLTIDPSGLGHVWIVDSKSDAVYQYDSAATLTDGQQPASRTFVLATANQNPQGIAGLASPIVMSTARAHAENPLLVESDNRLFMDEPKSDLYFIVDEYQSVDGVPPTINQHIVNKFTDVTLLDLQDISVDSENNSVAEDFESRNRLLPKRLPNHSVLIDSAIEQLNQYDDTPDEGEDDLIAWLGDVVNWRSNLTDDFE